MTEILITGRDGQVGWELLRVLQPLGRVLAPGRKEMDLTASEAVRRTVRTHKPEIIVNAAAYTAVDQAEGEKDKAWQVNSLAPRVLAEEAERLGSLLIHYSTDYIFDGNKEGLYREDDPPNPLNVYGASKLAGEEQIRKTGADHLILRTSWVYSRRGRNFLLTMLRLFRERENLSIIADQTGAPTWSRLIAETTGIIVSRAREELRTSSFTSGTYHLTGRGATSWHGFASAIKKRTATFPDQEQFRIKKLQAIAAKDYPSAARRPRNSRLSVSALEERFNLRMPPWDHSLDLCLDSFTTSF